MLHTCSPWDEQTANRSQYTHAVALARPVGISDDRLADEHQVQVAHTDRRHVSLAYVTAGEPGWTVDGLLGGGIAAEGVRAARLIGIRGVVELHAVRPANA